MAWSAFVQLLQFEWCNDKLICGVLVTTATPDTITATAKAAIPAAIPAFTIPSIHAPAHADRVRAHDLLRSANLTPNPAPL